MKYSKTCLIAAFAAVSLSHVAAAAPISWGAAFELETDTDLDFRYPVHYAINAGDNTGNSRVLPSGASLPSPLAITAGGKTVRFDGVEAVYGVDAFFQNPDYETFGDATTHRAGQAGYGVTFATTGSRDVAIPQVSIDKQPHTLLSDTARTYSAPTGDSGLDVLLNSQVFFDGRTIGTSALNILLHDLTPGLVYQVQVIGAADSRQGGPLDPTASLTDNSKNVSPMVTLNDGEGNFAPRLGALLDLDGDSVGHVTSVIGTFTANAETQAINAVLARGRNAGISGLIVTVVPEPATAALIAAGAVLFTRRSRNR